MKVKIKKLHPGAVVPKYATPGAGCFDLVAIDNGTLHQADGRAMLYRTGLAFEIPPGWIMEIDSRSGHGFKNGIRLSNCSGQIDSDYRGEVMVSLRADASVVHLQRIVAGDRIAQAKIIPAPQVEFELVDELDETERGTGGFGSTGTR
jgi:dUTP pyrophosphatase